MLVLAFYSSISQAQITTVWVEDALPAGATAASDGGDSWNWINNNPLPYSGTLAHQSGLASGEHQHYFYNAAATLSVGVGDSLFAYVYLDPANPPSEVMLQWNDGGWEHRAYWGANLIAWGADGTVARHAMGALPAVGQWVRLEVAASAVGLEGRVLNGMAFTLYGGRATWDHAGKAGTDVVWVEDSVPAGAVAASDGDPWNWITSNPTPYSGAVAHQSVVAGGEHQHYFYNAAATLSVGVGENLFAYVYLDPANPPSEVMLQWNDGGWEHRAYWGANLIAWGADGTVARHAMGALPAVGQWVRLEVAASVVGLEGRVLNGMAFTLADGRATWDYAGKSSGTLTSQSISFNALANQTLGAAPFALSATASSGLPVTFASLTSAVCTVSASTVMLVAAGTCTIRASQTGNATYAAATNVDRSFQVTSGAGTDTVWVEDAVPAGATAAADGGDNWNWISSNPTPYSGAVAHQSVVAGGEHQHYFYNAAATLSVGVGDSLFAYVYLDPANPPSEVMLQWNDGSWEHRAYWGANLIPWGSDGTVARHAMGALPAVGQWVRLEVAASVVGLEGHVLNGMAFTLADGRATWDYAGKSSSAGPASQSISFNALTNQTLGSAPFTVSATATSGLPVSFASLTIAVCTVSVNTVTLVAAGTCTIRASQAGNASYSAAPNIDQSFQVANALLSQTITFAALGNQPFGTAPFGISATASSGLPVSLASLTAPVCTVSGSTVTLVRAGTCTTQASQAGNATYAAAPNVSQSFTVTQAAQTISFGALSSQVLGAAPFTVVATASSGLPVTFSSLTSAVCTVSGSTVTLVGAGTCTIQASQSGNANYAAAANVSQSFAVTNSLQSQTITFGALSNQTFGTAPFTVSATASSGLPVSFASLTAPGCTVSGSTVTVVGAGTCTIQASQAGNATYAAAPNVSQSFTVTQAAQSISFGALGSQILGAAPFSVSATASSGLAVSFASLTMAICTVSGNTVTLVTVGTCAIQASQSGNVNYAAAANVSQSFAVTNTLQSQTITFGALSNKALGAAPFTVSATASSGLSVSFASLTTAVCTVSASTVTLVSAGTCTIQASQAGNATYSPAANVNQSFSVTQPAHTVSLAPAVNYATGTYPNSIALGDFNGDGIPDLAVANAFSANVSILIGHADGTFTPGTPVICCGEPMAVAVGDFNGDGKLDLAVADFNSGTVIIFAGNGNATFTRVGSFSSGLYPINIAVADINGDGKLDLVIANNTSGGTTGQTVTVLLGNGDGSFRAPVAYPTGASPYAVVVADFNGDGKPDLAVANGGSNTVSILRGNGDGTFAAAVNYATGTYPDGLAIGDFNGDGKLDLAVVNDYSGNVSIFLGNGDGTFGAATNFATGFGSASVAVADFNGDGRADLAVVNRFDNTLVLLLGNANGTFQAPLTYSVGGQPGAVVAKDLNGDGKPDLIITSVANNNISVLLQTSSVPAALSVQSGSPQSAAVGSVYATPLAVLVRDAGGYSLPGVVVTFAAPTTGATGTFSGAVASVQAATNASGVATAPTLTANATQGSFNVIASVASLNATFALTNTAASNPAPVFISGPPPNGMVNASYNFSVTAIGTPAPTFSVLANSLPTGLSLNGISGLIAGTPSTQGTFAGMFTATNGVPPDATQAFAITIAGLGQTVTFGALSNKILGAAQFMVSATASSGLPVSFSSLTTPVCTVSGNTVTLAAAGTCTIRATQAGNSTYAAAPSVDRSFTVTSPPPLVLTPDSTVVNVDGDEVSLTGTFQAPLNSGLLVNGRAALIDASGHYYVDHVAVVAGTNTVTLTLTTMAGQALTQTVQVTATGNSTPIVFSATPNFGVAPLTTSFAVQNRTGVQITKVEFDQLGNGNYIDLTAKNGRFNAYYGAPGSYHPRLRVTDANSRIYLVTTTIVVQDGTSLDQMLRSLWSGMNSALVAGDINSATRYLGESAATTYGPVFATLNGSFPGIVASYGSFLLTHLSGSYAEYAVTRLNNGTNQIYLIYFMRNNDGIWRLDSM